MNWTEVKIFTSSDGIEAVCGSLHRLGINGFRISDPKDLEEFIEKKDGEWDYIDEDVMKTMDSEPYVAVYLSDDEQGRSMLSAVRSELEELRKRDSENSFGRLAAEFTDVREEDWANNWKQYFKPFNVGVRLLVKPSWEECEANGRTVLEIDPASSFGTGQHSTTKLCLEFLEKYTEKDCRQLDLGCGSGILSIAGMLLGAGYACAVDIDSGSVRTAAENAAKNNIPTEKYETVCGNILADEALRRDLANKEKFNIVTANIVADVLIAMSPIFGEFMTSDGLLIVSGIIIERADEVIDSIRNCGFTLVEIRDDNEWAAALFRRSV